MKPRPVAVSGVDSGVSSASRRHQAILAIQAAARKTQRQQQDQAERRRAAGRGKEAPASEPPDAENSR